MVWNYQLNYNKLSHKRNHQLNNFELHKYEVLCVYFLEEQNQTHEYINKFDTKFTEYNRKYIIFKYNIINFNLKSSPQNFRNSFRSKFTRLISPKILFDNFADQC